MPLDFPNSPTVNQTYTGPNNVVWQWDGSKWVSGYGASTAYAPVNSPQFLGDPTAPTAAPGDADASIATTAFVAAAVAPDRNNVGRNLLHNSMFNVQQRGAGPWTLNGYTADRFQSVSGTGTGNSTTIITLTDADRAAIGDEAAVSAFQCVMTGTAGAGDFLLPAVQALEDVLRLAGKTITVSFWARATTGTPRLGISLEQGFGSGGSTGVSGIGAQFMTLSTTWTRYVSTPIALPSSAGKTLGTGNATYLNLSGSSGATNNTRFGSPGVQSYTLQLWGVQLEIGNLATPLEKRDPADELALCQRFYQGSYPLTWNGYAAGASTNVATPIIFAVAMRATPTLTFNTGSISGNLSAPTAGAQQAVYWGGFGFTLPATGTGYAYWTGSFTASADL